MVWNNSFPMLNEHYLCSLCSSIIELLYGLTYGVPYEVTSLKLRASPGRQESSISLILRLVFLVVVDGTLWMKLTEWYPLNIHRIAGELPKCSRQWGCQPDHWAFWTVSVQDVERSQNKPSQCKSSQRKRSQCANCLPRTWSRHTISRWSTGTRCRPATNPVFNQFAFWYVFNFNFQISQKWVSSWIMHSKTSGEFQQFLVLSSRFLYQLFY